VGYEKPGTPLEPWIKEYMELLLSREGQDILSDLTKTDGFLPLDPASVAKERRKLD
jgi:phosphate transport system substrate-binding protein